MHIPRTHAWRTKMRTTSKPQSESSGGPGRLRRAIIALAIVVPLAACLATGWFGFAWYSAANSETVDKAHTRHTVLQRAEQVAINLNTVNQRNGKSVLGLWLRSTTGALHKELSSSRARYKKVVSADEITTKVKVRGSAVRTLDTSKHTAVVLVGIDVTVTPPDGKPSMKRERLKLTMQRTPHGWKASRIQAVPV